MRVKKDKYLLTEIANEFQESKIGNELTLLECLREGQLKACIMYPPYNPRPVIIPEEEWITMASEYFRVSNYKNYELGEESEATHQEEYALDSEFAFEEESDKLASVADAIVARDTNLIHPEYKKLFTETDKINLKKPSENDWRELVYSYSGCCHALGTGIIKEDFSVYVLRSDWINFLENYVEKENSIKEAVVNKSAGRKEKESWYEIYEYVISSLLKHNSDLLKNRSAFAKRVESWAAKNFGGNETLKHDTISRRLKNLLEMDFE